MKLRSHNLKWINSRPVVACAVLTVLVTGITLGCGVDWPVSLLSHREANLLELIPMDWLSTQIEDLVPAATDSLQARENDVNLTTEAAERRDIDNLHAAQLQSMRSAATGERAYELGQGLAEAVRLYVSGAVEYHRARDTTEGNEPSARATRAATYFSQVLALPSASQTSRATWAAYMAAEANALIASEAAKAQAVTYYARVRELARQGFPDPLGLAVASFGEEARLELSRENYPRAIELYLEQAARGSQTARNSLRQLASRLIDDPELAGRFINDPRVQRLWFAAALAEGRGELDTWSAYDTDDESDQQPADADAQSVSKDDNNAPDTQQAAPSGDDNPAEEPPPAPAQPSDTQSQEAQAEPPTQASDQADATQPGAVVPAIQNTDDESIRKVHADGESDSAAERPRPQEDWSSKVTRVTEKIDTRNVSQLDQLSALAYAMGKFDVAAALAKGLTSPIACVVRAKLALRAGDRDGAAREYDLAISGREQARTLGDQRISAGAWNRVLAEHGILAVSRGDYVQALQNLLEAGNSYWRDAAYIAERVLTLDELVQFAHDHVPPDARIRKAGPTQPKPREATPEGTRDNIEQTEADERDSDGLSYEAPVNLQLRLLLARRLMRAGRIDEAIVNFRNNTYKVGEKHEDLADISVRYAQALHKGKHEWTGVRRAQALYEAATLTRTYGMELFGYELAPDYYFTSGSAELGQKAPEGPYVGPDETRRFEMNAPKGIRFHYRGAAADLAQQAADNLPHRSQAFAAVLCIGLQWTINRDPARATSLYERYVREGPYVGWSKYFGTECETPDFDRAETLLWKQRGKALRTAVRPYKLPAAALAMCGAVALSIWISRRRKAPLGSGSMRNADDGQRSP